MQYAYSHSTPAENTILQLMRVCHVAKLVDKYVRKENGNFIIET